MHYKKGDPNSAFTVVYGVNRDTEEVVFFRMYQESDTKLAQQDLSELQKDDKIWWVIGSAEATLKDMISKMVQWEKLDAEIGTFYEDLEEGEDANLCDIGEAATTAFNYL